jgi:hypothetical protein
MGQFKRGDLLAFLYQPQPHCASQKKNNHFTPFELTKLRLIMSPDPKPEALL